MSDLPKRIEEALVAGFAKGAYTEYEPDEELGAVWERVDGKICLSYLAETLMRELGLREESESYAVPDSTRTRYVTDWKADDE
jgi:hypothetical protein